jgi:hypothetical protein
MNVTISELESLCSYVNTRIVPGDRAGVHCDGSPRFAREFLKSVGREDRLPEYLKAGLGECDCVLLMQYPGIFHDGHERLCECCGEAALVTTQMVHGVGRPQ